MELSKFTYISLILFTISYPLFKSFEDKISYASKWKYLFPGIIGSAIFFIVWDVLFTQMGIWEFNPDYTLGIHIINLPLEEWLFFIVVPFSCVFIYEVMNYFVKKDILQQYHKWISIALIPFLLITAFMNSHKLYTFFTFIFLAAFLLIHLLIFRSSYMGRFYITWLVCMVPFLLVNGVLTAMPVVIYNDAHNLGIRIYTIPFEDVFYGMLNILQVITIYEWLKNKKTA